MEEKIITIQEKTVVNAGAATTMIYSCLCITFAANLLGFVGEGAGRMRYRAAVSGAGRPVLCDGRSPKRVQRFQEQPGGVRS